MPSGAKLKEQIQQARSRISDLFVKQCLHGHQATPLEASGATACGQFLDSGVATLEPLGQRGIHGTASALRVLAETAHAEAPTLVARLVRYLETREAIEIRPNTAVVDTIRSRLAYDKNNVIKVSEVLYALSYVQTGVSDKDGLVKALAESLLTGIRDGKGWPYFLDQEAPELLPTAYAVLALERNGYGARVEVEKAAAFLMEEVGRRTRSEAAGTDAFNSDTTTNIVCLYALTFRRQPNGHDNDRKRIRQLVNTIWKRVERLLDEDIEQNIEYWHEDRTFYVRVPWQLYLLALIARHNFYWIFSGYVVQRMLVRIVNQVNDGGFRYPHSGQMLSSRTNAILFEVLTIVAAEWRARAVFIPVRIWDAIVRSRLVRIALPLLAVAAILWTVILWWYTPGHSFGELGPHAVWALLAFLLACGRGR